MKINKIIKKDAVPTYDINVPEVHHYLMGNGIISHNSSVNSNTTNGLYPVRGIKILKGSDKNKTLFIAPESDKLKSNYQLAWDLTTLEMIDVYSIVQKFTGQSISADFYIDYNKLPNGKIDDTQLVKEFLYMTKMGMKTRYYINSRTDDDTELENDGCEGGVCSL
jgi:ribonucleoside-diphosphate reductase alpha chain